MSMAKIRFSRKTIGIAIASAVAMGGIAVPQAGAMGGYTYNHYELDSSDVQSWSEKHPNATSEEIINYQQNESPLMPVPGYDIISTVWNLVHSNDAWAGYATDVPTSNGVIDGLFVSSLSGLGSPLSQNTTFTYGTAHSLKDVQNEYPTLNGKESRPLSIDAKRVLYTAARLGHASVNGITPDVKAELKGAGYDIDDAKSNIAKYLNSASEYGEFRGNNHEVSEQDVQDGVRKEKGETPRGARNSVPVITLTDFLFTALSTTTGGAWSAETDYKGSDEPATLDQIRSTAKQNAVLNLDSFSDDYNAFVDAVIELASTVTEEEIENSDIPMYWNESEGAREKFQSISAIDVANAKFNLNTPAPATDIYVTDIKWNKEKGLYEIYRSDVDGGKTVWKTIDLSDLRNRVEALENKETVSPEDFKKVQDDLDKTKKDVEDLKAKDEALQKEIDQLKKDVEGLDKRVTKLEKDVKDLKNSTIKEVVKNGDGTYTLIRVDGTKVPGNIDPRSGSVTDVKTDGQGNLVITIDGKDKTVPLDQVKVTEENKGTPKHTVTITTPDGKSVTFNVFDTYVTDIKWNEAEGVYEIYRSDVDGGKTVWKTIDLSDLRNRIDALEKKDSPSRDEYNTLVTEVRENRELIEKLKEQIKDQNATDQEKITSILEKITEIEKQLTDMQADLDDIKARLTKVEGRTDDITKCVAGAGMAGIPALLSIPLMVMTQLNIPGIKDLNTQIQKQIGIYNPELARQWERNGGVLQAGAVLAGLAGMIGGIAYLAKQCDPMMKTPAGQDTDLGKLSSKLEKKDLGSSKKDAGATQPSEQPSEQDAPAADADAEAPAEAPAEGAVEGAAEPATQPSEDIVAAQ